MYIYLFFLIAAALAIPTFGLSMLVFFVLKSQYDKRAMSAIFSKAVISMREELTEELHRVNRGAIHKLFDRFSVDSSEQVRNFRGLSVYWGVFRHPMIDEGRKFSLRVIYMPRGHIHIKAAPGVNDEILSDRIFGPLGGLSGLLNK